jgi:hypothetical protein
MTQIRKKTIGQYETKETLTGSENFLIDDGGVYFKTSSNSIKTLSQSNLIDEIQTLSGDVQTLSGDVQTLSGDVETLISDVQTLSGDVELLQPKYLVLTATLRQDETDDPELFILDNTFDVEFNIERISTGVYGLSSPNFQFTAPSRTFITVGLTKSGFPEGQFGQAGVDVTGKVIIIQTGIVNGSLSDGLLTDTPIEIRFYI